jgi:hypothetical protein
MSNLVERVKGHEVLELCREIAGSTTSDAELVRRFGGTDAQDLIWFAEYYAPMIAAIQAEVVDLTQYMWISKKELRIAEYQADVERLNELLLTAEGTEVVSLMKAKHSAMAKVADEMGAIPQRMRINAVREKMSISIGGADDV